MDPGLFEVFSAVAMTLGVQHAHSQSRDTPSPSHDGPSHEEPSQYPASEMEAFDDRGLEEEALVRATRRVLVNMLNELRTPLMMLTSPLESGGGIDDDDAAGILKQAHHIQQGIERAIKIIQMDADRQTDDGGGATDLVDAVSYFVSSIRPRADRQGARIRFDTRVRQAAVRMNWPRVELLLESVADYALRGLGDGGTLTFSVDRVEVGEVVLGIRSDGRLEPVEPHLDTLDEVGDPLTLGLLLGMRTVRRHEGRLEFVQVDEDVSCRIYLPSMAPEVEDEEEGSTQPSPDADVGERPTTVLVVDDHSGTRAYLRFALRKHHRILEAADGKEALEIVQAEKPDLVISDIMMPVMDGNELCRAVKTDEDLNHIPVFLVTANSIKTLKTESLESGADDFLVKPFDVKEAVIRINNEIEMRRKLRSRYSRELVIKPSDITITSEDEAFINRARDIIEDNMSNAEFSIQDLSSEMGLSSRQLQRRLRETVDQSPVEFVRTLRLKRAAQLLGGQYGNVSEVAYAVGFTSLSYFAKCFREEYGTSPSSYKEDREV